MPLSQNGAKGDIIKSPTNKYLLRSLLGFGSFGSVWKCSTPGKEQVAVKICTGAGQRMQARLTKEFELGRTASDLLRGHGLTPCVVESFMWQRGWLSMDYFVTVMEYIEGVDLGDFMEAMMKTSRGMVTRDMSLILGDLSVALDFLHRATPQFLHRDLKPENVMLSTQGRVCLCDFGTSRGLEAGGVAMTRCGTVQYLAPEVVAGRGYGTAADIWSLGTLAYEMACLALLFDADSPDALRRQQRRLVTSGVEIPEGVPAILAEFILKCLQLDPSKRATAWDLRHLPLVTQPLDWNTVGVRLGARVTIARAVRRGEEPPPMPRRKQATSDPQQAEAYQPREAQPLPPSDQEIADCDGEESDAFLEGHERIFYQLRQAVDGWFRQGKTLVRKEE